MKLNKKGLSLLVIPAIVGVGMLNISKQLDFKELQNPYIGYSTTADPDVVAKDGYFTGDSFYWNVAITDTLDNTFENNYSADALANPPYNSTISAGFSTPGNDGIFDTADDEYFETNPGDVYIIRPLTDPDHIKYMDGENPEEYTTGIYAFTVKPEALSLHPSDEYRLKSMSGLGVSVAGTTNPIVDTVHFADSQDDPELITSDDTIFVPAAQRTFIREDSNDFHQTVNPNSPTPVVELGDPYKSIDVDSNATTTVPPGEDTYNVCWKIHITFKIQNWEIDGPHSYFNEMEDLSFGIMRWDTDPSRNDYFEKEVIFGRVTPFHIRTTDTYDYMFTIAFDDLLPGKYTIISVNNSGIKFEDSSDTRTMTQMGLIDPADLAPFGITNYPASASLGYPIEDFTFMIGK